MLQILGDADDAGAAGAAVVAAHPQELDLDVAADGADQIRQEDEAALQHPDAGDGLVSILGADLAAQGGDALLKRHFVNQDPRVAHSQTQALFINSPRPPAPGTMYW